MGKGDIRTKKGKIWRGTTGVSRPRKKKKIVKRSAQPVKKVKDIKALKTVVAEAKINKQVVESLDAIIETTPSGDSAKPSVKKAAVKKPAAKKKAPAKKDA